MLRLLLTISLILFTGIAHADIGNVVKQRGIASVERSTGKLSLIKGSGIEFKDNVRTGNGNIGIKFAPYLRDGAANRVSLAVRISESPEGTWKASEA